MSLSISGTYFGAKHFQPIFFLGVRKAAAAGSLAAGSLSSNTWCLRVSGGAALDSQR